MGRSESKMLLGKLFRMYDQYIDSKDSPFKSLTSRRVCRARMNNLWRLFDTNKNLKLMTREDLQEYIHVRLKEGVSPTTVKKEIQTFVSIRNWWLDPKLTKGLVYKQRGK